MSFLQLKPFNLMRASFIIVCITIIHLVISEKVVAQKVTVNVNTIPAPSYPPTTVLNTEQRKEVLNAVDNLLTEYLSSAKLINPDTRKVDSKSIERFKQLFHFSALIVNDLVEYPPTTLVTPENYARSVFNNRILASDGVELRINNVTLVEIKDDKAGFYIVKVEVSKSIFNYISEKKGVIKLPGGRIFTQVFTIDVLKDDFSQIKISKIEKSCKKKGDCPGPSEDRTTYAGLVMSGFYPFVNATPSSFFVQNHPEATISVSGKKGFSFGYEWTSNGISGRKKPEKKLYFTVGVGYAMMDTETQLQQFELPLFMATATGSNGELMYQRSLSNSSQVEKLRIQQISLALGLGYRVMKKTNSEMILFARVIPSYVLSRKGEITGTGNYDANIDEACWRLLEEGASNPDDWNDMNKLGPFNGGIGVPTNNKQIYDGDKLMWTVMLSPVYYFELSNDNPTWSFLIGIDLGYNFSNLLAHNVANSPILQYADETNPGLTQQFIEKSPQFITGIRIGIQRTIRVRM